MRLSEHPSFESVSVISLVQRKGADRDFEILRLQYSGDIIDEAKRDPRFLPTSLYYFKDLSSRGGRQCFDTSMILIVLRSRDSSFEEESSSSSSWASRSASTLLFLNARNSWLVNVDLPSIKYTGLGEWYELR